MSERQKLVEKARAVIARRPTPNRSTPYLYKSGDSVRHVGYYWGWQDEIDGYVSVSVAYTPDQCQSQGGIVELTIPLEQITVSGTDGRVPIGQGGEHKLSFESVAVPQYIGGLVDALSAALPSSLDVV